MSEQSLADLQRLVDRSRRDSRHNYGAHPTGAGGSLHTPHPKQGAGRKQIGPGEFGLSRPPIGEIIRLHVHGHLGNGGEPALFDSITYQNGFNQATAPNPQLQLPYNAIYGIEGEVRWTDGYTGGGEVWLYLDAAPYMQLPGFTDAWTRWPIAMEFDAQKGARLSLVVVHDDSADHDMEGEVVVATKERLVQLVDDNLTGLFAVSINPREYSHIAFDTWERTVLSTVDNGHGSLHTDDAGIVHGLARSFSPAAYFIYIFADDGSWSAQSTNLPTSGGGFRGIARGDGQWWLERTMDGTDTDEIWTTTDLSSWSFAYNLNVAADLGETNVDHQDMAWVEGQLWTLSEDTNGGPTHRILQLDPADGSVEGAIDLSTVVDTTGRDFDADAIAYANGFLWLSWKDPSNVDPKVYKIDIDTLNVVDSHSFGGSVSYFIGLAVRP